LEANKKDSKFVADEVAEACRCSVILILLLFLLSSCRQLPVPWL